MVPSAARLVAAEALPAPVLPALLRLAMARQVALQLAAAERSIRRFKAVATVTPPAIGTAANRTAAGRPTSPAVPRSQSATARTIVWRVTPMQPTAAKAARAT